MASKGKPDAHPFQRHLLLIICVPTFYSSQQNQVSRYQVAPQPDTIFIFTLLTSQLLLFWLSPVLMVGMQGH
ncbi:TPA: hypothetical protein ACIWHZ_004545, partial [Salmonella enterica subsp. enterica serovar Enteritidis]